jgi:carbon-monoxide dehydrogenase medium subunit
MPITAEFDYHKPGSLQEAVRLLDKGNGRALPLAGGTDLIVWLKEGIKAPEALVDVKSIAELQGLTLRKDGLRIGAAVTFAELIASPVVAKRFPVLWEAARTVASCGVRHRATLAGNICSAVPCLDGGPALLTYEARVQVCNVVRQRDIPISEWFVGPKRTALRPGELVTGIVLAQSDGPSAGCYVKLGRYRGEDLAQVGLAVLAEPRNRYKVAFCAVGPVPKRAEKIERLLAGKKLSPALIAQAKKLMHTEISPISDIRASKEYRLHMAEIMLERGLTTAVARLSGKGPAYGEIGRAHV